MQKSRQEKIVKEKYKCQHLKSFTKTFPNHSPLETMFCLGEIQLLSHSRAVQAPRSGPPASRLTPGIQSLRAPQAVGYLLTSSSRWCICSLPLVGGRAWTGTRGPVGHCSETRCRLWMSPESQQFWNSEAKGSLNGVIHWGENRQKLQYKQV